MLPGEQLCLSAMYAEFPYVSPHPPSELREGGSASSKSLILQAVS